MLYIHGIGHFHPENVIDNRFLEELGIETSNEWIIERVGIHQRRTVLPLDYIKSTKNKNPQEALKISPYTNAITGAKAALMALERANLKPEQIGMVIAGSCMPQNSIPADACTIAAELGIEAPAFDINSACSSFAIHMHMIASMNADALPDYILLVIPENVTRSVDFSDRSVAVLWGDGSSAIIVSKKIISRYVISQTTIDSNPQGFKKVMIPLGGHFAQEGSSVQKFAIKRTVATIKKLREMSGINASKHYFIGHQANLLMLQSVCNLPEIPIDKHLYNVDKYGNCGAAGAPTVLSQNWHIFKEQDKILLAVAGAGLSWGGMVIEVN